MTARISPVGRRCSSSGSLPTCFSTSWYVVSPGRMRPSVSVDGTRPVAFPVTSPRPKWTRSRTVRATRRSRVPTIGPVRLPRPRSRAESRIGRHGSRPRKYTNWILSTCGTMPSAASSGIENVSVFSRVSLMRRLAVIGTISSILR